MQEPLTHHVYFLYEPFFTLISISVIAESMMWILFSKNFRLKIIGCKKTTKNISKKYFLFFCFLAFYCGWNVSENQNLARINKYSYIIFVHQNTIDKLFYNLVVFFIIRQIVWNIFIYTPEASFRVSKNPGELDLNPTNNRKETSPLISWLLNAMVSRYSARSLNNPIFTTFFP